ncbi:YhjD/YihY/BrkB family envelope integrity protein [Nocardioides bruguierae]|uniref:YhjD/YihY/BrkB family envelope integrity protein n=1 Tax=Nocardioides bruguierae TaxID=2945102 RepID=UPI002020F1C1|nr:YhjD/YihY/BrkB family envelope integrity protein [Nocardioides bruguierae]MCL8026572.1 YihY/virulence factor BrkB family protein [Nocardioides bruguierae]
MTATDPDAVRAVLAGFGMTEAQLARLDRLPPRYSARLIWLMDHWPGRVGLRVVAGLRRIQVFDRAMTIAAQLFTSVFPVLIMGAALLGSQRVSSAVSGWGDLSAETQVVLDEVAGASDSATFGLLGVLVVLISATSLSRAMIRAYDAVWMHGRSHTRLDQAWRWFVAVLGLALTLAATQKLISVLEPLPPRDWWATLLVGCVNMAVATLVPWFLLAGRLRLRWLAPGAALFALGMLLAHPVASRYLSVSIELSATRFGSIGVAFTYLTYLYAVSWWLLVTAVVGQVVATDEGSIGRLVRGRPRADGPEAPAPTLEWDADAS